MSHNFYSVLEVLEDVLPLISYISHSAEQHLERFKEQNYEKKLEYIQLLEILSNYFYNKVFAQEDELTLTAAGPWV